MKKLLLTALLCGVTAVAFGQGAVQFRNYYTGIVPAIDAPVYLDTVGGARLDASNPLWRAALVGGATTGTPWGLTTHGTLDLMYYSGNTTVTWVNFRTGATPPAASGYINVGSSTARVVPTVDWGGTALVQMVAWQGAYTTFADAWTAAQTDTTVKIGVSAPLTLVLPPNAQSTAFTYLAGLQSFAIQSVPEPTTFALAGLGAAALLIFRRRS